LKEITDFEWDRVYIYESIATEEELKKLMGDDYNNIPQIYKDEESYLIWTFFKNNKIVLHDDISDFLIYNEKIDNNKLIIICITKDNAVFEYNSSIETENGIYDIINLIYKDNNN
jgi:hypothetical protein